VRAGVRPPRVKDDAPLFRVPPDILSESGGVVRLSFPPGRPPFRVPADRHPATGFLPRPIREPRPLSLSALFPVPPPPPSFSPSPPPRAPPPHFSLPPLLFSPSLSSSLSISLPLSDTPGSLRSAQAEEDSGNPAHGPDPPGQSPEGLGSTILPRTPTPPPARLAGRHGGHGAGRHGTGRHPAGTGRPWGGRSSLRSAPPPPPRGPPPLASRQTSPWPRLAPGLAGGRSHTPKSRDWGSRWILAPGPKRRYSGA
jgi:hypothetical protein